MQGLITVLTSVALAVIAVGALTGTKFDLIPEISYDTVVPEPLFEPTWSIPMGKYEYIHIFPEQVPTHIPGVDPKHTIPRERACMKIRHILGFRLWNENACYDYYTQELEV